MKAAVMYGPNDIRVEEYPKPTCDRDGMILRVDAIGLCGSDIRNLTTDSQKGKYPVILGHEHVGTVVEIGEEVTKYSIGDRLYVYPGVPCFQCEYCRSGKTNLCINSRTYADIQGGFAEYLPIPKWGIDGGNIWKIPEGFDLINATLAEPLSSVYACQENINVTLGDVVVIIGAGPIGCFHAELAKLRGAAKVIMIEINDDRLQKSLDYGVDYIINSSHVDAVAKVKELTNGKGADKVISANPSTKAQEQAIFMCAQGGIIVFFGGVPKGSMTTIDSNYIHYNNLWIYGHYGASSVQCKKAFDLIISQKFKAEKYITAVLPLDEINNAIKLVQTGKAMKIVLTP